MTAEETIAQTRAQIAANAEALARGKDHVARVQRRVRDIGALASSSDDDDDASALLEVADACLTRSNAVLERGSAELRFYSRVFAEAPCALIATSRSGIIREANEAAALALRVPRAFLRDRPLIAFVARGDCDSFRSFVGVVTGSGADACVRLRARHGGGVFAVELRARACTLGLLLWVFRSPDATSCREGETADAVGGA